MLRLHLFPAQVLLAPCPLCGPAILFYGSKAFYSREKAPHAWGSVYLQFILPRLQSAVSCSLPPWAWRSWRGGQYMVSWTAELSLHRAGAPPWARLPLLQCIS